MPRSRQDDSHPWRSFGLGRPGATHKCLTARLHYDDGATEDFALFDGEHFGEWGLGGAADMPKAKLAFKTKSGYSRYFTLTPGRPHRIERIEFIKEGEPDRSAPKTFAITIERPAHP